MNLYGRRALRAMLAIAQSEPVYLSDVLDDEVKYYDTHRHCVERVWGFAPRCAEGLGPSGKSGLNPGAAPPPLGRNPKSWMSAFGGAEPPPHIGGRKC